MKKNWSILIAGALVASVFAIPPASAAQEVPATVNIEDPAGDSNGLNDQGDGSTFGDNPGGVNFVAGDFLKVWFTTTDKLNVHIQTSAPGGGGNWAINYRIFVNDGCDAFQGTVGGKSNADAEPTAIIRDFCTRGLDSLPGEITVEAQEDETGITTLSYPLGEWPGIEMGATLTGPYGTTRIANPAAVVPQMDTTAVGTDYMIVAPDGAGEEPPTAEPPSDEDPPGQGNQKCSKIKDKKKKKACKKNNKGGKGKGKGPKSPPVEVCEAYEPGEAGAEAETLVVTHEQTEEAPAELTVATAPGLGAGRNPATFGALVSHAFVNLQVDIEDASGGLWVTLSSADYQDYDLYLDLADGTQVAASGGFGPEQDGEEGDSHTDFGSETLTGIKTNDCGGYTLDIVGAATQGGDTTLTAWIGDELWDPAAGAPVGKRMVD